MDTCQVWVEHRRNYTSLPMDCRMSAGVEEGCALREIQIS